MTDSYPDYPSESFLFVRPDTRSLLDFPEYGIPDAPETLPVAVQPKQIRLIQGPSVYRALTIAVKIGIHSPFANQQNLQHLESFSLQLSSIGSPAHHDIHWLSWVCLIQNPV